MSSLALVEALPLGHVLVAEIAAVAGIRTLAIKGPISDSYGLRRPKHSVDIDVWVEPGQCDRLTVELANLGWVCRVPSTAARLLPAHSIPVAHRAWPCEIDVHWWYPGLMSDAQDVFEQVWARRDAALLAGREVPCADRMTSVLLRGLQILRDGGDTDGQLSDLAERIKKVASIGELEELRALASAIGGGGTLLQFIGLLGLGPPEAGEHELLPQEWVVAVNAGRTKSVSAVYELSTSPVRSWPAIIWRSLLLTEAEIREAQPMAGPGRLGLLGARIRRLRRGLRDLPRAIAVVVRARQDRRRRK